jgi:dTMP kinase
MSRGKFIVVEGIDGCGKDTQIDLLVRRLNDNNKKTVKFTNINNESPIGHTIRMLLSVNQDKIVSSMQLAHIYTAELYIVANEIYDTLEKGINQYLLLILI